MCVCRTTARKRYHQVIVNRIIKKSTNLSTHNTNPTTAPTTVITLATDTFKLPAAPGLLPNGLPLGPDPPLGSGFGPPPPVVGNGFPGIDSVRDDWGAVFVPDP